MIPDIDNLLRKVIHEVKGAFSQEWSAIGETVEREIRKIIAGMIEIEDLRRKGKITDFETEARIDHLRSLSREPLLILEGIGPCRRSPDLGAYLRASRNSSA